MGRWPHRLGNSPNADELPGVSGGVLSEVQGGKFGAGFLASAFSSVGDSFLPDMKYGNVVKAAVIGGTASEIGGGEFANGAVTASFTYLFNQALTANSIKNKNNGLVVAVVDGTDPGGPMMLTGTQFTQAATYTADITIDIRTDLNNDISTLPAYLKSKKIANIDTLYVYDHGAITDEAKP